MAIKSGRVGVRTDQVDVYGRIIITDGLIDQIRDELEIPELAVNPVINPSPISPTQPLQPVQPLEPEVTDPIDELIEHTEEVVSEEEPLEEVVEEKEVYDEQKSE